ncbi:hypothetical protein CASFOL_027651 [Castilleja foliolosa]|uniref:PHD-type domain-containing protein n=1 Tax=Castilleja foliolosa TaxID=1961234 RepID=A0ABD3CFF2_9LAMI
MGETEFGVGVSMSVLHENIDMIEIDGGLRIESPNKCQTDETETRDLVEIDVKVDSSPDHCVKRPSESRENENVDEHCPKKSRKQSPDDALCDCKVKTEPSNDDNYSEVSNPNSSSTISSQLHDVVLVNSHSVCDEITSACSQDSNGDTLVSTSRVVLEIPKNVSTTGVRKITFKLKKQKEDYDVINTMSADDDEWNALEMPKKIISGNYPSNVEKLLATRILEGARVKYISISGAKELPGIIADGGYLCGCSMCNYSRVVSGYEFELHAGTKTRHPSYYVYLENGKPIYSIIEQLKNAPLTVLDDVIRAAAGSSVNEEYFEDWKATLQCGNDAAADNVYHSQHYYQPTSSYPCQPTEVSHGLAPYYYSQTSPFNKKAYVEAPVLEERLAKKPKYNFSSSAWKQKKASSKGGKKKRDNDLHKSLFMPNGLPDGTDLAYYSKGKRALKGYKMGNGIFCSCCNTEISPSQFEAHAGSAAKRQPYRHIYTSSGLSLHDIAVMLANGQNLSSSSSDDMCSMCGDRGELLLCNGCPRAFHAECLGLQHLPEDDWLCRFCRDKFGPGGKASGKSRHNIPRQTRVVKAPELEPGGCVLCRSHEFSGAKFDERTMILCDQCEKEYHVGCLRESGMCDLQELPRDKWFCCHYCSNIFSVLQNLTSSGPEVIPGPVSAEIHRKHAVVGLNEEPNDVIQWCILSGKSRVPEHLLLLSRAAAIFRECFDPIVATSGRDLIPVMVYGRNISGQEFSGMYCIVLIVKSIVVSAALLRIFGQEVAELPLVATCKEDQGKGYFQALFSCIERLLSSMNVKNLVLPAAEEAQPMWLNKLGFRKTSHDRMLKYTRDYQLTMFKRTSLLEKEVQQLQTDDEK